MKRTIFLHVGIEKTGSTTLQAVGGGNRDLLKQRGILYPSSPGQTNHTGLAVYASTGSTLMDVRQIAGLGSDEAFTAFQERFPEQLRREIEESGCERVWLSNEHLSSRVRKPAEILRLARLLQSLASEIRIIIYIRDQPDLLVSHYSTKIRSGSIKDLTLPRSEKDYFYNFALMLQRWSDLWGKDALDVRIFDRASLKDGDVTSDFFEAIGERLDGDIRLPAGLNQSLDAYAIQFLRLFNTHIPRLTDQGLNPEYGQIASVLAAASRGPKFTLPALHMRQVADMFEESNTYVAEHYFAGTRRQLFGLRDYSKGDQLQVLGLATAQTLGAAALDVLDTHIANLENRVVRTAKQTPPDATYQDSAAVLQSESVEGAVSVTARLWQARQQRLRQMRSLLSAPAHTA